MVIKDVRLRREKDATVLSARCKIRKIGWDTVYFSLDAAKYYSVAQDASPFAAALLLPSMKQGEDLIIKGSISKQLYAGMHAIMDEVLQWDIGLQPIVIQPDSLRADRQKPSKTASFFSGGVDSFYTYLKHKNDTVKANRVDSLVLVNGFDIDPRNQALWQLTLGNVKAIAKTEKVELVVVNSNIHALIEPILPWDYSHGGCMAAVGLFLRKEFRQFYIPSTHSVAEQIPWGSNMALDAHWSTESISFIHDGSEATRLHKVISQVSQSPVALKHLRVCYVNAEGAYNCGRCDKCLRTMVNLYIAGTLEQADTFPHTIDTALVADTPTITGPDGGIFHGENLAALQERDLNPALQQAITASLDKTAAMQATLIASLKGKIATTVISKIIYLDYAYTYGYLYAVSSSILGKWFDDYLVGTTDCRPFSLSAK